MAPGSNVMCALPKFLLIVISLLVFGAGNGLCRATMSPLPTAESVRVDKSERKRHLLRNGKPYKTDCISLSSHPVGDKVQQGDKRTPEGRYIIDWRNLQSHYHRALHVSCPNAEDRREARERGVDPGGMIMIHGLPNKANGDPEGYLGMDWTDGCIAVGNREIEELLHAIKDGTPIEILP